MSDDAFDIEVLRSTDTEDVAILHPVTGQPTTWKWTLAGPGHPRSIEVSEKSAREALSLERQRTQAMVNRKKWVEPDATPEQNRRKNADSFASRVLGWTPARINGEDYPFSHENCVRLLLDPTYGRVYLQLLEHFGDEKSFTNRSAMNSSNSQSETSS